MVRKFYIDDTDGGGGGGPTVPKGYTVSTPQQRADWNAFLDYAGKQPGANLSDPKQQAALLASYKKANPNFSITPEQIPSIQYEGYQLRKGDSFGNLGAKELGYIRQGLQPGFLNADTTNIGKLYYPQEGNYGTDLENYYNSKFNPQGASSPGTTAATGSPNGAAATSPQSPKAAPVAFTTPLPTAVQGKTLASSDIPATYADHDTAAKRAGELASVPGNEFLHGRADALINANYVPEWTDDTKSLRDSARDAAKGVGLDPAFFWGSAAEEGATGLITNKKGELTTDPDIDLNGKYRVSGFVNFGLDNFHDNFKELVKRGYLPKDFDYKESTHVNEHGDTVHSGDFKTVEDALKAKAAYVRMEQDNLDNWMKTNGAGATLSPAARQFFTVVAYNGGPGTAHKMIKYYRDQGLLDGDKFLQQAPPKSVDPGDSYGKVLPRWKMGQLLKKENIL